MTGFVFEQPALARQPASKPRQRTVAADHPMAWHDHGNGIGAIR
jgi:hypothetical protein